MGPTAIQTGQQLVQFNGQTYVLAPAYPGTPTIMQQPQQLQFQPQQLVQQPPLLGNGQVTSGQGQGQPGGAPGGAPAGTPAATTDPNNSSNSNEEGCIKRKACKWIIITVAMISIAALLVAIVFTFLKPKTPRGTVQHNTESEESSASN